MLIWLPARLSHEKNDASVPALARASGAVGYIRLLGHERSPCTKRYGMNRAWPSVWFGGSLAKRGCRFTNTNYAAERATANLAVAQASLCAALLPLSRLRSAQLVGALYES